RGPGRSGGISRVPSPPKGRSIGTADFVRLEVGEDGRAVAVFQAVLRNDGSNSRLTILAEAHPVADGAPISEEDLPANFVPEVVDLALEGKRTRGRRLLAGAVAGEVTVRVAMPEAPVAVGVKLKLDESE